MDGARFDGFARALARGTSRRTLLRLLGGGSLAGLAALPQPDEAGAFTCRQPGVLCAKDAHCCSDSCNTETHRCNCPGDGQTLCRRECVDLAADPTNCGDCGHGCQTSVANAHPTCTEATCGFACDDGFMPCADGTCVPNAGCCTNDDCTSLTTACQRGVCQADHTCGAQAVDDDLLCPGGICCGGSCVDATSDQHCGTCATICSTGTGCAEGQCVQLKVCSGTTCTVEATDCCTDGDQCQDGCCYGTEVGFNTCCQAGASFCSTGDQCQNQCCYQSSPRFYTCCLEEGSYCDTDLGDNCQDHCCYGTDVGFDICCQEGATGYCDKYLGDSCQDNCCYGKDVGHYVCCQDKATGYCIQGDSCSHYCCYGKDVGSNICCQENAIGTCQSGADCHLQCCYGSDCH